MMKFNMNQSITVKGKSKTTVKVTDKDDSKVYPSELSYAAPIVEVSPKVYNSLKTDKILRTFMDLILNIIAI